MDNISRQSFVNINLNNIVEAINNYFMQTNTSPAAGLQIMQEEPIADNIGELGCDCKKNTTKLICADFSVLPDLSNNVKKILYNMSFFNQTQKAYVLGVFLGLHAQFSDKYSSVGQNINGENDFTNYSFNSNGYYYYDNINQSCVYCNTLNLMIDYNENPLVVPIYNMIQVFPFAMSDYYYTFLYIHNNSFDSTSHWYKRVSSKPVTANYYKFIEDKIRWYTKKNAENPKNFINGKYYGPDYINYLKAQVKLFNKNNKPYVNTYKTRPFVEPDFSRLLGGKFIRRKHTARRKQTARRKNIVRHKKT